MNLIVMHRIATSDAPVGSPPFLVISNHFTKFGHEGLHSHTRVLSQLHHPNQRLVTVGYGRLPVLDALTNPIFARVVGFRLVGLSQRAYHFIQCLNDPDPCGNGSRRFVGRIFGLRLHAVALMANGGGQYHFVGL